MNDALRCSWGQATPRYLFWVVPGQGMPRYHFVWYGPRGRPGTPSGPPLGAWWRPAAGCSCCLAVHSSALHVVLKLTGIPLICWPRPLIGLTGTGGAPTRWPGNDWGCFQCALLSCRLTNLCCFAGSPLALFQVLGWHGTGQWAERRTSAAEGQPEGGAAWRRTPLWNRIPAKSGPERETAPNDVTVMIPHKVTFLSPVDHERESGWSVTPLPKPAISCGADVLHRLAFSLPLGTEGKYHVSDLNPRDVDMQCALYAP